MVKKKVFVILLVVFVLVAVAAGLITWLVLRFTNDDSDVDTTTTTDAPDTTYTADITDAPDPTDTPDTGGYETILLEGDGIGEVQQLAAFTRFRRGAHMFWWFFPTEAGSPETRPIILWLDGVVGLPPSLLANFASVGPYDFNLNKREDSWVTDYNLLFVDAPVGSGFSFVEDDEQAGRTPAENAEDLVLMLKSFLSEHEERFNGTPLYILGQGYGAQMATRLALLLQESIENGEIECNLQGVLLGNPIISPAQVTSKLGFYLEELGYIDDRGRSVIEDLAEDTLALVEEQNYSQAFQLWSRLEETVSQTAGAVAVNIRRIVDKLTRNPTDTLHEDECRQCAQYIGSYVPEPVDVSAFMDELVAPALGISSGALFDAQKGIADSGLLEEFMKPAQDYIERILQETELNVWIYNGNLDAVSNTPGQLLWIESLEWSCAQEWAASARRPLAVSGTLEGYVRSACRLHFYWMNVAGHAVPIDSPVAMREVLRMIAEF